MKSLMKKQAERFLRERKRYRRWLAVFLCLAVFVTSGTFTALRQSGQAMEYEDAGLEAPEEDVQTDDGGTEEPDAEAPEESEDEESEESGVDEGEETPQTEAPEETEAPVAEDPASPAVQEPEESEQPEPSEEGDQEAETPESPEQPEQPEQSKEVTAGEADQEETPAVPEEETPEEQPQEEEEEDLSELMTLEELENLPEDEVGCTMWKSEQTSAPFRARARGAAAPVNWNFDAHYVNENDSHQVTKTTNFNLKYQLEFRADRDFEKETVFIRVPAALFAYRNGNPAKATDIAVGEGTPGGKYTYSRGTPFNYYYEEEEDGVEYLVFYNYRKIDTGTNAAWQVLYKNLQIMEIVDETEWSLEPTVTIREYDHDDDGKPTEEYTESEYDGYTPMTGKVDSSVQIDSLSKVSYKDTSRQYTPGLYTKSQVKQYLGIADNELLPGEFEENFESYKYVVWDIKVTGTATQPWQLQVQDDPVYDGIEGKVVGFRDHSDSTTVYRLPVSFEKNEDGSYTDPTVHKDTSWGSRFYVVTAYPTGTDSDGKEITEGTALTNNIKVAMVPVDEKGDRSEKSSSAEWGYLNYHWTYLGDALDTKKDSDDVNYIGWLDVYAQAKQKGEDYGNFPFYTTGSLRGYKMTREISSSGTVGPYLPGNSYELATMDDRMYIDGQALGKDDYYYTEVSITQKDYGYDIYEDRITERPSVEEEIESGVSSATLDDLAEIDRNVYVYAMYEDTSAVGNAGSSELDLRGGWELAGVIPYHQDGVMKYEFTPEQIARKPWRVMVIHRTVEYSTSCQIDLKVRLRHDSAVLAQILNETDDGVATGKTLLNVSGTLARKWQNNKPAENWWGDERNQASGGSNYSDAKWPGLQGLSESLYGALPRRENAGVELKKLGEIAESYKTSKVTNDVSNERVLVDFYLTAYDGYEIYSQDAVNYLKSVEKEEALKTSPGRNQVVFYDLLPAGVSFDPSQEIKAGRITALDSVGSYKRQPKSWDSSQVTVTVDSQRDIIENWRNTGRTMVIFHIAYSGEDPSVYTNEKWIEGWGVSFRTYYDWKDFGVVKEKYNVSAFMPETGDTKPLLGTADQVAYDDGEVVPSSLKEECKIFGSDINGDNVTGIRNVLYAQEMMNEDVALSSVSGIQKLVRADDDRFGAYSESATVAPGDTYTYHVAVTASSGTTGLIVYDHLENAEEKGQNETVLDRTDFDYTDASWKGTFQSIDVSALTEQGIDPVVWYSAARNASIPETDNKTDADWTSAGWTKDPKGLEVQAVAVDMRNAADGGAFTLKDQETVSFTIRMQAPEKAADGCAYNHAGYISDATVNKALGSNTVRVLLEEKQDLEIIKQFDKNSLPGSVKDTSFRFRLYESYSAIEEDKETEKQKPFANKEYLLYKKDDEGNWAEQTDRIYATDASGYLDLCADEKAVFRAISGAAGIQVEEEKNIFWNPSIERNDIKGDGENLSIHQVTVTNAYRPVLYVQKLLSGQPEDVNDTEFTFKIETKSGTDWVSQELEYCYVDSIRTDGGSPTLKDDTIYTTGKDGSFQIKKGDIIALFPGKAGTEFRLTEDQTTAAMADWICKRPEVINTLSVRGTKTAITNYYKWKDLYLTKELTHQDAADCTTSFTFRIEEAAAEGSNPVPAARNRWTLLSLDQEELSETGTLNENGVFTANCAGKIVRIEGLEAEKTYVITEVESGETVLYRPVNGTQEVTMPLYSSKAQLTFVNDYLKRPLSVTKTLLRSQDTESEAESEPEPEFTMVVRVSGEALAEFPYTLMQDGNPVDDIERRTDEKGQFTLKGGQTAVFKDAGKLGEDFTVSEVQDKDYPQLSPSGGAPFEGTFVGDEASATIVNGERGAFLTIRKEYVAAEGDETAEAYVEEIQNDDERDSVTLFLSTVKKGEEPEIWPASKDLEDHEADVETWHDDGVVVRVIDELSNETMTAVWRYDQSIQIQPWKTIIIETKDLPEGAEYILKEAEKDQHRIFEWNNNYMQVSQKDPADDQPIRGTVELNPIAVITNEVETLSVMSKGAKKMAQDSVDLPEGAELVWRVERYDGTNWKPAADISYFIAELDISTWEWKYGDKVQKTGEDGRIVLKTTKRITEPADYREIFEVFFIEDVICLNLYSMYKEGDLRLVEVPEESDDAWGMLVGYGRNSGAVLFGVPAPPQSKKEYSLDVPPTEAYSFVNSNKETVIEIGKEMENSSGESFTMLLKQVISVMPGADDPITEKGAIQASEVRQGIRYIVCDSETGAELKEKEIGKNGEIELKPGQYAKLYVPSQTAWTVSEDLKPNYNLKDIVNGKEDDKRVSKLDENLVLIDLRQDPGVNITSQHSLTYIVNDKQWGEVGLYPLGAEVTLLSLDETLIPEGYEFIGWSEQANASVADNVAGDTYTINGDTTLYAVLRKIKMCTVDYYDFKIDYVDDELQKQVGQNTCLSGEEITLLAYDSDIYGRDFCGWSQSAGGEVIYYGGDKITVDEDMALYAVWEKSYILIYKNPVTGEILGSDSLSYDSDSECTFIVREVKGYSKWCGSQTADDDQFRSGETVTLTKDNPYKTIYAVQDGYRVIPATIYVSFDVMEVTSNDTGTLDYNKMYDIYGETGLIVEYYAKDNVSDGSIIHLSFKDAIIASTNNDIGLLWNDVGLRCPVNMNPSSRHAICYPKDINEEYKVEIAPELGSEASYINIKISITKKQ